MRNQAFGHALVAFLAWFPAAALAGVTTTIPSATAAAGATVQVACFAEGTVGMSPSTVLSVDVTVSGGTVAPAQLTNAVSQPCSFDATRSCSVIQGTVNWTTPATLGDFTVTCTATFKPTFGSNYTASDSKTLTTVAGTSLPPIVSAISGPDNLAVERTASFSVTASDPSQPPRALTYMWGATGGTIVPDPLNPAAVTWQAPANPGSYTLMVNVSNGQAVLVTKTVNAILATYQAPLAASFVAPRRLSIGPDGGMAVVDRQATNSGTVTLVTARGELLGTTALPMPALAVAHGAGVLWATTSDGKLYKIDPATGRVLGEVPIEGTPLDNPVSITFDPAGMRLWVVEPDLRRVRVVGLDGKLAFTVAAADGSPLLPIIDVGIDAAHGRAWVLVANAWAESDVPAGSSISLARFLHAYDLSGVYVGSYVKRGSGAGELTRAGGLAVSAEGRVFVSDSYQSVIQVYSPAAAPVAAIGNWGTEVGQLSSPTDLAIMANGDLAVANTGFGRIDRFGTGVGLPVCAGDSDCDGLPDSWELAHGLNPYWAGDALADLDGDHLLNVEEKAHGTDPNNPDTDGDGYSDGDEVLAGFNPTDPNDHGAVIAVSGPSRSPPGLVRLSAVASGPGTCTVEWVQKTGATVTLKGGATSLPSFVARAAGTYAFDATATCGSYKTAPARVAVEILNVAPRPDAGRTVVASPGILRLDALPSSDANGDLLTFMWDQMLGAPALESTASTAVSPRLRAPGLYAFQLTASDGAGGESKVEVPVLVTMGNAPTALARALPADAEVGGTVALDASASVAAGSASFQWRQVGLPAVTIGGSEQPVASFSPAAPGRYVFEVELSAGALRSPPKRVEVFVAQAGGTLPVVTATAPAIVAVNDAAALEASASAGSISYAWTQVSGPAAGLTGADGASATAVPFAPGFYVFEVSAKDGDVEGRPARVAFEARAGGAAIPVARAAAPQAGPVVGQLVFLDGRASTGAARYRWTQVDGPWVVLSAQSAVTSFLPLEPGTYVFELEVENGTTRSAPARVAVTVSAAEGVL